MADALVGVEFAAAALSLFLLIVLLTDGDHRNRIDR